MIISRLKLKNWRNFREIDVSLRPRQFIVGPNACGKSNLLDVFRFLRDIVKQEGGGLQKAVKERGGISKIRSLSAKNDPEIGIDISFADNPDSETTWRYSISIKQEPRGYRRTLLTSEKIWKGREPILDRPNKEDKKDPERLKQTYLEQVNSNQEFREISKYLDEVTYIHLVPQLLRYADSFQGDNSESDPFGQGFLTRVAKSNTRTQKARLSKIEKALKIAVPQFKELKFERDLDTGKPHLKAMYSHWRHKAGWQREDQFSDGTLRLIGLLWALLEGDSLLLLEEPELSLHSVIVSELSSQIYRMQKKSKRQVLISTHSADILSDDGIDGREVLMITPKNEGSKASIMSDINDVKELLSNGFTVGEIVSSKNNASKQQKFHQSSLFQ